jgi:hypothetical protein
MNILCFVASLIFGFAFGASKPPIWFLLGIAATFLILGMCLSIGAICCKAALKGREEFTNILDDVARQILKENSRNN